MMDAIKFNCFVVIVNIKSCRFVKRFIDISLFYFALRFCLYLKKNPAHRRFPDGTDADGFGQESSRK